VNELFKVLGYTFKDLDTLKKALTHSSAVNKTMNRADHTNQRLEFLGDALLEAVISKELYFRFPKLEEGALSRMRAAIVREETLAEVSRKLSLDKYLILGKGEELSRGRDKDSILSDCLEALIGAVYVDSDFTEVEAFIINHFEETITDNSINLKIFDYKTMIQELLQKEGERNFYYSVVKEEGKDHLKIFHVVLLLEDKVLGEGKGSSKKDAEQKAAMDALEKRGKSIVF